jgi:hypothetical protein
MQRHKSFTGKPLEDILGEIDDSLSVSSLHLNMSDEDPYNNSSLLNGNSSTSGRSFVGRKKNRFTLILEQFYTKNSRNPKKEFFNTFVIRSIKRIFRYALTDSMPRKTCVAISEDNPVQMKSWETFKKMFKKQPEFYAKISLTTNAPLTDGKSKRKEKSNGRTPKSHNNTFCRTFFLNKKMQKSFFVLMNLLFSENQLSCFNSRFKFMCCVHNQHNFECFEKWNKLKNYLYNIYFDDLEIEIEGKLKEYSKAIFLVHPDEGNQRVEQYQLDIEDELIDLEFS